MIKSKYLAAAIAAIGLSLSASAFADAFVNGGFEDGNLSGWISGAGYRGSEYNSTLTPSSYLPSGSKYNSSLNHVSVVSGSAAAPYTDGNLSQVYSGTYSVRVGDTTYGGYAAALSQTVDNYSENSIFFAWAAVLEGAHGNNDAATFILTLVDNTTSTELVRREYSAASGGGGIDSRFTLSSQGYYYTSWQIEELDVSDRQGHSFTLSLLAADCQPTGHAGFVYLDGFGGVTPPGGDVPLPGVLALLGIGALGLRIAQRKRG